MNEFFWGGQEIKLFNFSRIPASQGRHGLLRLCTFHPAEPGTKFIVFQKWRFLSFFPDSAKSLFKKKALFGTFCEIVRKKGRKLMKRTPGQSSRADPAASYDSGCLLNHV